MTKTTILSVEQTDKAGLFTIIFEGEGVSEFDNFYNKFINDAERSADLQQILTQIDLMMNVRGFTERNFRFEGKNGGQRGSTADLQELPAFILPKII